MTDKTSAPGSSDPMHGITLKMIVTQLYEHYGWHELGQLININCFQNDPSIQSSLKFLRRTPWARAKVERLYQETDFEQQSGKERAKEIWSQGLPSRSNK